MREFNMQMGQELEPPQLLLLSLREVLQDRQVLLVLALELVPAEIVLKQEVPSNFQADPVLELALPP